MEESVNFLELSKVDELSVRKICIEKILKECKTQVEDKAMLLLGKAFDDKLEVKAQGQIVFLERWIKDIDKEIEGMCPGE